MFFLGNQGLTVGVSNDITWTFACDSEENAFTNEVSYTVSYQWSQITSWDDSSITENTNSLDLIELFGWNGTENSIPLATNDVLNGISSNLIEIEVPSDNFEEGSYYIIMAIITVDDGVDTDDEYVCVLCNFVYICMCLYMFSNENSNEFLRCFGNTMIAFYRCLRNTHSCCPHL